MATHGLSLLTAGAALLSVAASVQAADKRPGILVIRGDDIGTENTSYYNRSMTGQFGRNHQADRDEHLPTMHGFDEFLGIANNSIVQYSTGIRAAASRSRSPGNLARAVVLAGFSKSRNAFRMTDMLLLATAIDSGGFACLALERGGEIVNRRKSTGLSHLGDRSDPLFQQTLRLGYPPVQNRRAGGIPGNFAESLFQIPA